MMQRVAIYVRQTGTEPELIYSLRRTIEHHGDTVVATYSDDGRLTGRGKYAAWHRLIASLDTRRSDRLSRRWRPPRPTVADLLKILGILRDLGVALHLHNIGNGTTTSAVLDIIRNTVAPSCRRPYARGRRRPLRLENYRQANGAPWHRDPYPSCSDRGRWHPIDGSECTRSVRPA